MNRAKPLHAFSLRQQDEALGFTILKLSEFRKLEYKSNRCSPHRINFYLMIVITDGIGYHLIDFKTYNYRAGNIIFVSKGQVHQWDDNDLPEGFMLVFTDKFLTKYFTLFSDLSFVIPFKQSLDSPLLQLTSNSNKNTFKTIFGDIYNEFHYTGTSYKNEIITSQLRTVFLKLLSSEKYDKSKKMDTQLELFIRFQQSVDLYYTESRNAADYLNWLSVSYTDLNAACKNFANKTIKQYIDDFITVSAKRLLSNKTIPIHKIAIELGFDEPTNFTKYFKNRTGATPKQFRCSF